MKINVNDFACSRLGVWCFILVISRARLETLTRVTKNQSFIANFKFLFEISNMCKINKNCKHRKKIHWSIFSDIIVDFDPGKLVSTVMDYVHKA